MEKNKTELLNFYGPKSNNFANFTDAMESAKDYYANFLQGGDLTFIGAYIRTAWTLPEKITPDHNKLIVKVLKKAKKWAQFRADFRI